MPRLVCTVRSVDVPDNANEYRYALNGEII